jgi:Domain of unknown function (DUF1707)
VAALLVSDQEREYTVGLLRGHMLSGRLTAEEFEERGAEVWRARYASELWHALRALPVEAPPSPPKVKGTSAAVSLVLGIVSICLLVVSFGLLFVITLPLSVTAWALGRDARRSGATAAGEVVGIVGTVLSMIVFAGCAAVLSGL